jgi:class 3 adenylate cyclase
LPAGLAAYFVQDTLLAAVARGGGVGAAAAAARVERWSATLVALAAAGALVVAFDSLQRRERLRALAAALLPAHFAAVSERSGKSPFEAHAIYYADEPHVTLLFCDAVGFTRASLTAAPADMMASLGALFRHFDALHAAAGIAKVETAGDEYFSVAGAAGADYDGATRAPPDARTQARTMARLALDLVAAAREHAWPCGEPIEVRVGLHCGPAVSGLIGGTLPRLGIFGKAVVVASRMESEGAPGCVHVSADFAAALRAGAGEDAPSEGPAFELVSRTVDVKGIGKMRTFFVKARLPERVGR